MLFFLKLCILQKLSLSLAKINSSQWSLLCSYFQYKWNLLLLQMSSLFVQFDTTKVYHYSMETLSKLRYNLYVDGVLSKSQLNPEITCEGHRCQTQNKTSSAISIVCMIEWSESLLKKPWLEMVHDPTESNLVILPSGSQGNFNEFPHPDLQGNALRLSVSILFY